MYCIEDLWVNLTQSWCQFREENFRSNSFSFPYPGSHFHFVSVHFVIQIFKVRTHTNVYKFWDRNRKSKEKCSMQNRFSITVGCRAGTGERSGDGDSQWGRRRAGRGAWILHLHPLSLLSWVRNIFANTLKQVMSVGVIISRQQA